MSRGLTSAQTTLLAQNSLVIENLLEISIGASTVYLTSASYDTIATTATSGGAQTFTADHTWSGMSDVPDKVYTTQNKIALFFEGDMTATFGGFATAPINFANGTTIFRLYKLFRNTETYAIESADPILIFDGILAKKTYIVSDVVEKLQLDLITNNTPYNFLPLNKVASIGAI